MTLITHNLYSDLFNLYSDLCRANEKTEKNLADAKVLIDALSKENDMERRNNSSLELDNLRLCQEYEKTEEKVKAIEETCGGLERKLADAQVLIDALSKANDMERRNNSSLELDNLRLHKTGLRLHRTAEYYAGITKAYCFFTECSVALDDVLDSHEDDYSNDDHVQTARDRLILSFHMTLKSIIDGSSQTDARSSIDPIDTASFRPPSNVDE